MTSYELMTAILNCVGDDKWDEYSPLFGPKQVMRLQDTLVNTTDPQFINKKDWVKYKINKYKLLHAKRVFGIVFHFTETPEWIGQQDLHDVETMGQINKKQKKVKQQAKKKKKAAVKRIQSALRGTIASKFVKRMHAIVRIQALFRGIVARRQFQEPTNDRDYITECVVCLDAPNTHALVPCGHKCICDSCIHVGDECPLCRAIVTFKLRIFE